MDKYAVFGNPITHSKSPQIHTLFAEQTKQNLVYTKNLIEVDEFSTAAKEFFKTGKGLNITVPFKLDAFEFADSLSARAECAGAVNTLILQADGSVRGDNTDGLGMVADISERLDWAIANKRVLILGAGGAVRGVLQPLLEKNPALLVVANRTASKAVDLAEKFSQLGPIKGCGYGDIFTDTAEPFDLVINGTSASLAGDLPPLPENLLAQGANCYDMMYGVGPTVFMRWAEQHGAAHTADGLGMLVGQAAESFNLWRGVKPEVQPVITQLRIKL